jgi:hypothetical protein
MALFLALVAAGGLSTALTQAGTASAEDGGTSDSPILSIWEVQSLTGAGNNRNHPTWGAGGTIYPRQAPARYADGLGQMVSGPNARYLSNRIINDTDQHLYSERNVSQWAFAWGQFLDHTFALRLGRRQTGEPGEPANIPTDSTDPLESFRNDLGMLFFERSIPAPGTGETSPREQINQASSYIDAEAVYGNTDTRLDWLRDGTVDGNPDNNDARLLLPGGYLPRRDSRGDPASAPSMVVGGPLLFTPFRAAVAGDQRANENPLLLATQTLFAREHNRIVSLLPAWLSQQDKFQIARAVVIAEQQYVTYTEFLPSLGVTLPRYTGYKPRVAADVTNEFATVGYRAHSQIRSDFTIEADAARYSQATLDTLRAMGIAVTSSGDTVGLHIPLAEDAFFNPDLLELLQLGPTLEGIGLKPQARNDELIDNLLRSLIFQLAGGPGCQDPPPACLIGTNDLSALDIQRGRDHGMPTYNQLRQAYGLPAKTSFQAITGEASEAFPPDPELTPGNEINDPDSLDYTALYDVNGNPTTADADNATSGVRRTPLAARLKASYGNVDNVDAFIGMISEAHLPGTDFGELQLAIWRKQFTAMRDGDRFFYANDPLLQFVHRVFGIDYHNTLGDLIALNTDIPRNRLAANVFVTPDAQPGPATAVPPSAAAPEAASPLTRTAVHPAASFRAPESPAALPPSSSTSLAVSAARVAARRPRRRPTRT